MHYSVINIASIIVVIDDNDADDAFVINTVVAIKKCLVSLYRGHRLQTRPLLNLVQNCLPY